MTRYTLKVCYGSEQIERFDHRSPAKLQSILTRSSYYCAGHDGPFGTLVKHPDTFELFNPLMEKIYRGNIKETVAFVKTLR